MYCGLAHRIYVTKRNPVATSFSIVNAAAQTLNQKWPVALLPFRYVFAECCERQGGFCSFYDECSTLLEMKLASSRSRTIYCSMRRKKNVAEEWLAQRKNSTSFVSSQSYFINVYSGYLIELEIALHRGVANAFLGVQRRTNRWLFDNPHIKCIEQIKKKPFMRTGSRRQRRQNTLYIKQSLKY